MDDSAIFRFLGHLSKMMETISIEQTIHLENIISTSLFVWVGNEERMCRFNMKFGGYIAVKNLLYEHYYIIINGLELRFGSE